MASTYLSRTSGTPTSQKTGTFSLWIKRSELVNNVGNEQWFASSNSSTTDISNRWNIKFTGADNIELFNVSSSSTNMRLQTNRVFKDVNAWYHIVITVDTTQATASDRLKMWVNGVQETSFSASTYPSLDDTSCQFFQSGKIHRIGAFDGSGTYPYYLSGLITHYHYTDGTAYDASTFGESDANGVWKPKTSPSVTYGTNGFFLKFENSGSMGTDSSGNGNNFTVNGTMTQTLDTPSNVYATFNPLSKNDAGTVTFSNGNLTTAHTGTDSRYTSYSTLAPSQGKWYAEFKYASTSGGSDMMVGIGDLPEMENINRQGNRFGQSGNTVGYYSSDGNKYVGPSDTISAYGNSYAVGDIIGVAMDLDNGYVYFSKNGTWQNSGDPTSGASGTGGISFTTGNPFIIGSSHITTTSRETSYNGNYGNGYFGTAQISSAGTSSSGDNSLWEYDCPSGYYGLSTKNIAQYG